MLKLKKEHLKRKYEKNLSASQMADQLVVQATSSNGLDWERWHLEDADRRDNFNLFSKP